MTNTPVLFAGIGIIALVIFLTVVVTAMFLPRGAPSPQDLLKQAADADAADFLDYLEQSKLNLYFNKTISAWGLVDDEDKLVSAGHSVRAAISRSQQKDDAERDELATIAAMDFNKAEMY